jgi:hypothetical protein
LELCKELAPRGNRLFRRQLVAAIAFKPRLRFGDAQTPLRVCAQRGEYCLRRLLIRFCWIVLHWS